MPEFMKSARIDRLQDVAGVAQECWYARSRRDLPLHRFHDGSGNGALARRSLAVVYADRIRRVGDDRAHHRNPDPVEVRNVGDARDAVTLAQLRHQREGLHQRHAAVKRTRHFPRGSRTFKRKHDDAREDATRGATQTANPSA